MALARMNLPGVVLYGGSIAPGHVRRPRRHDSGRLRSGRRARRGAHERRPAARSRGSRLSRRRRLRRPVHGEHDGDGLRVPGRHAARAAPACPAMLEEKDARAREAGRLVMDLLRRGVRPRDILDPRGVRERHRRRRRQRRIDQRRAAPAGDRARSRTCRSRSTTSTASATARRSSSISSRAGASSRPISIARAARRSSPGGCSRPASLHGDARR